MKLVTKHIDGANVADGKLRNNSSFLISKVYALRVRIVNRKTKDSNTNEQAAEGMQNVIIRIDTIP